MLEFLIFALTVLVFLIFAIIYLYPGSKRSTTIPGPEPVDTLEGNTPDIKACGSLYQFLLQLHRDYGPIGSFWIGPQMFVSIASAELFAEQASLFDRACDLFNSSLILIGHESIQVTNGADGRRRHAAYSKCFTPTVIKSHFKTFNELASQLVSRWGAWRREEFIPVREHVMDLTIQAIFNSSFGMQIDESTAKRIRAAYDVCMHEVDLQSKGDFPEAGGSRIKRFNEYKEKFDKLIEEAIKRNKDDSSGDYERDSVIAAGRSLGLTQTTLLADMKTVFIGGFHTSASLITWAIYHLADNQEIQKRARDEVKEVLSSVGMVTAENYEKLVFLQQVLNESLRFAGVYAGRQQETDTVLGGHKIPAGTPVIHALTVAMNNPNVFPEPDKFDPDRFSAENVKNLPKYAFEPFGFAGKRKCIGYRFALAEATTVLANLLHSNLRFTLAPDQEFEPVYNIAAWPAEEVWISVEECSDDAN